MVEVTIKELAEKMKVDYPIAGAIVKLMVASGDGAECGSRPTATGKGKPSVVYRLKNKFTIDIAGAA